MSTNPYAAPSATPGVVFTAEFAGDQPARRFTRFAAATVDGILMAGILIPMGFATGYFEHAETQQVGMLEEIMITLLAITLWLALNGYLLLTRGQSIGKLLTKIQIVDSKSGGLLPFIRVYVYRNLWTLPLSVVVMLIPGEVDDYLITVVVLIDVLLIFGPDRRCLHDYIAGSKVVLYKAGRQRLM